MGVKKPLGDKSFWPIYEEAEKLDCPIAVHGAVSMGLGIEFVEDIGMVNRLEHPLAQLIQFTSMMLSGMFDEYPRLKVAYLEADTGWAPYMADRLAGRVKPGMTEPLDVIRSGRIYFSSEGDDPGLPYAIERFGDDALIYASDYPHEPRSRIIQELQEAIERPDVSEESKQKIYWENPRRLYRWDIANTLPRGDASLLTR
jgi:predicted TIM-barrel fold metal-dependent hydrolase